VGDRFLDAVADVACCDLTTTGRRSGGRHEIEIWFGVLDGAMVLVSGNGESADWFRNLRAEPAVSVRVGADVRAGVARVVTDPDERRRIGDVMGAKYTYRDDSIGLSQRAWTYEVPAVVIDFPAEVPR